MANRDRSDVPGNSVRIRYLKSEISRERPALVGMTLEQEESWSMKASGFACRLPAGRNAPLAEGRKDHRSCRLL